MLLVILSLNFAPLFLYFIFPPLMRLPYSLVLLVCSFNSIAPAYTSILLQKVDLGPKQDEENRNALRFCLGFLYLRERKKRAKFLYIAANKTSCAKVLLQLFP